MSITKRSGFLPYSKEELFEKINAIEIFQEGGQVVTKYFNRIINTTKVSTRYEIFDIRGFMKSKIDMLEANFGISYYRFILKRGVQELILLSDRVEIGKDIPFYKSFFILNSTDKSRKLNMNLGIYRADNDSYFISSVRNLTLSQKHLRGVTKLAEDASETFNGETFNDQIKSIQSLLGERVMLSKVRDIIVDDDTVKINHRKFDAFKNSLMYSSTDKLSSITDAQYTILRTPSEKMIFPLKDDFAIDAFTVFNCYMQVFAKQDSYIVSKETEKIMNITQCFIRNKVLEDILQD